MNLSKLSKDKQIEHFVYLYLFAGTTISYHLLRLRELIFEYETDKGILNGEIEMLKRKAKEEDKNKISCIWFIKKRLVYLK